jgi:hypothetical protein
MSNIMHCHLWLSVLLPRLHFIAIAILINSSIFFPLLCTRVLFTKLCKHHPKSAIERFNLPRENGGRGFSNLEILQHNQIAFLNRARDNTFFNALVLADKGYTPLNLSDNIISDIVEPNIPDTIANIKQKSLHGRYFKELDGLKIKYSP